MQPATEPQPLELEEGPSWGQAIVNSPWIWGGLLTFAFYASLPHLPYWKVELERYCAMHWVEYIEVGLFFVGMVVLVQKGLGLRHELQRSTRLPSRLSVQSQRRPTNSCVGKPDCCRIRCMTRSGLVVCAASPGS
jgi:hypothetical protein